jgi:multicomponent K+:H+ antiporter subunit D
MNGGVLAGHGIVLPIVLPLMAGALLLGLERHRARWAAALAVLCASLLVLLSAALLHQAAGGSVQAYLVGNWPAPYGIALALDRLSALLLLLTSLVALAALVYSLAGDAARGPHFHALFQFQLMGLNGAFLSADLFNLFVFFEVLLAASYGLLLHGGGRGQRERLKSGLHYVVFNLTGSALFLIAVSLLYGVTGTLNMADLAVKLPQLGPENLRLAQTAALLLLLVFAMKAALLPLYFWLPDTYASATAPVAALFAVLTKVGVYAIARVSTLIFGVHVVPGALLAWLALATLVLAAVGALAATRLRALVAYLVVASAGTLLLALGLGTETALAAGLFYLVNSTLIAAAWFLLADRISAARGDSDALLPAAWAGGWSQLGVGFLIAAVAVAGVPPLAGFMGKALLLQAVGDTPLAAWGVAGILGSSLALMVALSRAGSALFWKPARGTAARVVHAPAQVGAITALLAAVLASAVLASTVAEYTSAAARQLFERRGYIEAVLGAQPVAPAYDLRKEMRQHKGTP